jgi:uncharacterized caspase-like protein
MAPRAFKVTAKARPECAFALVIGNSAYAASPLLNAANDAEDVASLCTALGFSTQLLLQASLEQLLDSVEMFARKLKRGDVALFYFAGELGCVGELDPAQLTLTCVTQATAWRIRARTT